MQQIFMPLLTRSRYISRISRSFTMPPIHRPVNRLEDHVISNRKIPNPVNPLEDHIISNWKVPNTFQIGTSCRIWLQASILYPSSFCHGSCRKLLASISKTLQHSTTVLMGPQKWAKTSGCSEFFAVTLCRTP